MKWEPVAAMIALLLLGVWVVWSPGVGHTLRPGAQLSKMNLAGVKGELEMVKDAAGQYSFRMLYRAGAAAPRTWSADEFRSDFGAEAYATVTADAGNTLFRALNVTSWAGIVWVALGFGGQLAFSGRWLVQWLASEKKRDSVVPASFWWMSLLGGAVLFAYFAWRQDIVGVLGQTSGVVIYARNIRLLGKAKRRADRLAATR